MEAHAAIGPSWYPGTCIWEEAIVAFSYLAQAQQATSDPALITLEMGVILYHFLISLTTSIFYSGHRGVYSSEGSGPRLQSPTEDRRPFGV